ncbi:MAG: PilZ domain-containing protein [Terriglobales bacterium]
MSEEKRRHARVKIRVPVEMRTPNENPIRAETTDLSLTGFYVEMLFTLEVGTRLDINLRLGDATVVAVGEVVTCDRTVGNGVRFTRILPDDKEELDRYLQAAAPQ